jgi:hypothetical protein
LIHTYDVVDPIGLRRPELDAAGVVRRDEQPFGVSWRLYLMEKREGQPRGKNNLSSSSLGGVSPHLFIEGEGGGSPQGDALGFAKGEEASS